jgi:hypothetical protein
LLLLLLCSCSKLFAVGMRQSAAWGMYLVAGTTAQSASIALSLLVGGTMVANGLITPEQLTSFMFYVQVRCGGGGRKGDCVCCVPCTSMPRQITVCSDWWAVLVEIALFTL